MVEKPREEAPIPLVRGVVIVLQVSFLLRPGFEMKRPGNEHQVADGAVEEVPAAHRSLAGENGRCAATSTERTEVDLAGELVTHDPTTLPRQCPLIGYGLGCMLWVDKTLWGGQDSASNRHEGIPIERVVY